MIKNYGTREEWLSAAVRKMEGHFTNRGYNVPAVRVSCGWPSRGGLAGSKRTIGQCWSTEASSDGVSQIFISPWLDDVCSPQGVLATLVHEVVHAVVGIKEKHNKVFGKCARAVGLEGKLMATTATPELVDTLKAWVEDLGNYPHAKLDSTKSPVKKQSTRMIKCECGECGYIARTSQKWIDAAGAPLCPVKGHGVLYVCDEEGKWT